MRWNGNRSLPQCRTASVFARPGRPSSKTWPSASKSDHETVSIARCPTTTLWSADSTGTTNAPAARTRSFNASSSASSRRGTRPDCGAVVGPAVINSKVPVSACALKAAGRIVDAQTQGAPGVTVAAHARARYDPARSASVPARHSRRGGRGAPPGSDRGRHDHDHRQQQNGWLERV